MKMKKKIRSLATVLLTLCMLFVGTCPVMAEPMQSAEDPRESVMGISMGYETDNNVYIPIVGGSCFLVNDEYVLTCYHVLEQDQEFLTEVERVLGFWVNPNDSHFKIYVHISHDIKIEATMHKSVQSYEMDFALVKLTEKVYDRKPLALGDSDAVNVRDRVYSMGFPSDSVETIDYYTKDDVSVTEGSISKVTENAVGDIFEHTAVINHGSSGGPLLNENDEVIGVNGAMDDTKNYAAHINYIKGIMNTFGIPYVNAGATTQTPDPTPDTEQTTTPDTEQTTTPTEPDNSAILAELNSTISEAKAVNTDGYTKESVEALNNKIGSAEAVAANASATAQEITSATDALNQAMLGLEKEEGPDMILIVGIGAAVVIVIVIVVVVMSSKKKNQPQPAPAPAPQPMPYPPVQPTVSQEGAGETTLLNQGAGETTILGGGAGSAYLVRRKNGQKIMINVQNFKIGKERSRVNYCISDNSSISRVHCEVVKKGANYYVVDKGATNFTFVNGIQLSPNTETLLSNNAVLKLSDEEFEFHL